MNPKQDSNFDLIEEGFIDPLNALSILMELSTQKSFDQEYREMTDIFHKAISKYLEDFTYYGRMNKGTIEINKGACNFKEIFESNFILPQVMAQRRGIYLKSYFDDNLPQNLVFDQNHMKKIIFSIVTCAIIITNKRGIIVNVEWFDRIEPALPNELYFTHLFSISSREKFFETEEGEYYFIKKSFRSKSR